MKEGLRQIIKENEIQLMGISAVCIAITIGIIRFVYNVRFSYVESWMVLLLMIICVFAGYMIKDTLKYHKRRKE